MRILRSSRESRSRSASNRSGCRSILRCPQIPRQQFPAGGPIPPAYLHDGRSDVALSMAAAVTKNLKLATGICLVPEHEPLALAKQIATLGRILGRPRAFRHRRGMAARGERFVRRRFPPSMDRDRRDSRRDAQAVDRGSASFEGKYVKFPPVKSLPKPAQKSGPPVLIGSLDKNALKRVAKWADGWCPIRAERRRS